jgi:pyridoxal phosphate enzyme (YggS family)
VQFEYACGRDYDDDRDDNLQVVRARIATPAQTPAAARVQDVTLLAVSKTFGPEAVREAHAAGQRAFGENYVQEAVDKIAALADLRLQWHCIGPIRATRPAWWPSTFDWVHTVDRLKIAERCRAAAGARLPPLQVCMQVNIDGGASKSGVAPGEALALARAVARCPGCAARADGHPRAGS